MIKKWYQKQNGSMAVYVTVTVISFMLILTSIFFSSASIRKSQLNTILKIKEVYEQDIDNKSQIYEEQKNKRNIVSDGSYSEEKGVNTPKLVAGMTPVVWDANADNEEGTKGRQQR